MKVELEPNQGEMNINLIVNPFQNQDFLPAGLKLILLVGSDILAVVKSKSADNTIQQKIIGDIGDYFSISIVLGNAIVKEEFVI